MTIGYLLTWNAAKWPWHELAETANLVRMGENVTDRWNCSKTKSIAIDDNAPNLVKDQREEAYANFSMVAQLDVDKSVSKILLPLRKPGRSWVDIRLDKMLSQDLPGFSIL